jgi:hypothetical protein
VSAPIFMFCYPGLVLGGIEASGPVFMFCARRLIFGGTEGDVYHFLILGARTLFRQQRRALGPVFMFCAPGLDLGGTDGVGSHFQVLRSQTYFWCYRGRRVPFSCIARPDSFSAVPEASGPVFMFCAPGLIFDGAEGVGYRFHVLRSLTHFRCYRGRRVPFSCIVRLDSFSAVPEASGRVFMFCAPGLIFDGAEGVVSHFHVLRSRTHFRRWRGRRVPFSCFPLPDSFSALQSASGPVYMFCAPALIIAGSEGVGYRFHVLRSRTHFWRY